jgi:hypothetical protein
VVIAPWMLQMMMLKLQMGKCEDAGGIQYL